MTMDGGNTPEKYTKIWLSDFWHSFPHFNFSLNSVNSTFNPESNDYKEAVILWGLVPVAACVILWLVFVVYFICRCCQSADKSNPNKKSPSGFFAGLFILTAVGLLGYGFYENEEAHRGVEDCRRTVVDINATIASATQKVKILNGIADTISNGLSDELENLVNTLPNITERDKAMKTINHIRTDTKTVRGDIGQIKIGDQTDEFNNVITWAHDIEYFRWMINILVYCLYVFLLTMSFIGLLVKSKAVLVVSAALAALCSVFMWATTGVYLSASIILSDLCGDPDAYFLSLSQGSPDRGAIQAYIICDDQQQPYAAALQDALNTVSQAQKDLNETIKVAKGLPGLDVPVTAMRNNLNYATGNLSAMNYNVGGCSVLHADYVLALDAACKETLTATSLLTLVSCLLCVVCSVVIFTLSCAWRQFSHSSRKSYLNVDDTDPFLPRPPQYDHASQPDYGTMGHSSPRPWSERGTLQHGSSNVNTEDDRTLILTHQHPTPTDDSPPPAYHPGRYNMRQYADSAPRPGSVRGGQ